MKLIRKKNFAAAAFNPDDEIFVLDIAFFTNLKLDIEIHIFCQAEVVLLKTDATSITVLFDHANLANIFPPNFVAKFPD